MPEVPDDVNDYVYAMVEAWEAKNPTTIHPWSTTQVSGYGETIDTERRAYVKRVYLDIQEGLKRDVKNECPIHYRGI
jgi:hypothetical protein